MILDHVGNTPLIPLKTNGSGAQVFAKAEFLNPSGSVKDRAAKAMLLAGLRSGQLTKDRAVLDATSGNTGIALAMFGAVLGYRVVLCLPSNANKERKRILKAYDAEIIATNPLESSDGALLKAKQLAAENPGIYFYTDQYNNVENWKSHYNTTALEIWEQTQHRITHFVAGMGTSGTFIGTSRRLKELNAAIQTIPMQPASPLHGLEGMRHQATVIPSGFYDASLFNGQIDIKTEEARQTVKNLAKEQGLFVGISSGANVLAAVTLAETLPKEALVVTILCDSGYRYLSDEMWD